MVQDVLQDQGIWESLLLPESSCSLILKTSWTKHGAIASWVSVHFHKSDVRGVGSALCRLDGVSNMVPDFQFSVCCSIVVVKLILLVCFVMFIILVSTAHRLNAQVKSR